MKIKKLRKALILTLLLIIAVTSATNLTGCSNSSESPGSNKSSEVSEQRYAWPLATASPEDTVTQIFAEKFAEEVSRLSDGKMKIQVYPNSTLGGDRDLLESCYDGDIPFVVQNTAPQVLFMPNLAVFDLPYVFDSIEDCRNALDSPELNDKISEIYTNGGYHLLGMADQGFRVTSTNKPIHELKDFKGQKIRTMENKYHIDFWKSISANPTPMNFSEVYIGLQQHTIDAQENPYEVIVSNKLYEQQKYVVETNHLPHLISLIVDDDFYKDLPQDQQEILSKAAENATTHAREQADKRIEDRIETIESNGTKIIRLSNKTKSELRKRSQVVYDEIRENVSKDVFDVYTKTE